MTDKTDRMPLLAMRSRFGAGTKHLPNFLKKLRAR